MNNTLKNDTSKKRKTIFIFAIILLFILGIGVIFSFFESEISSLSMFTKLGANTNPENYELRRSAKLHVNVINNVPSIYATSTDSSLKTIEIYENNSNGTKLINQTFSDSGIKKYVIDTNKLNLPTSNNERKLYYAKIKNYNGLVTQETFEIVMKNGKYGSNNPPLLKTGDSYTYATTNEGILLTYKDGVKITSIKSKNLVDKTWKDVIVKENENDLIKTILVKYSDMTQKNGYYYVYVKAIDNSNAGCYIINAFRVEKTIKAKSIKLNKSSLTIEKGKTATIKATISPSNVSDSKITYKSSNEKIATVNSKGVIKGIKQGSVVITATTSNNKTASVKVKVTKSLIGTKAWPVENVTLYKDYSGTSQTGVVIPKETQLKITDVKNKRAKVTYNGTSGWIILKYCMVDMITYDTRLEYVISNASTPKYTIKNSSGKLLTLTNKKLYKEKIAAVMFDTAIKLSNAETLAESKGYRIVVYDAYRPQNVTKYLAKEARTLVGSGNKYNYPIGNLLAQNVSTHNYGIAVDITIRNIKTKKLLSMPTRMHYLGTAAGNMNDNSNILKSIMNESGMEILKGSSGRILEWWHYQNNDSYNATKKSACNFNSNVN